MKREHLPIQPQERTTMLVGRNELGWAGAINPGRRKPDQQDSLAWWTPGNPQYGSVAEGYLFIVADGVGGGTGGAAASYAAARTIVEEYNSRVASTSDIADLLTRMIRVANREVFALSNGSDMATTCACLAVRSNKAVVAWVGDSRIYCLRGQTLEQWTSDHSWAMEYGQKLVESGAITAEELATNKNRHQITRALGMAENVEPSVLTMEIYSGDRILVCSDGLWDALPTDSIREQLARTDLTMTDIAAELVAQANRRGGRDNISLFIIDATTILAMQQRLSSIDKQEATVATNYMPPEVQRIVASEESSFIPYPTQYAPDDERLEGVYRENPLVAASPTAFSEHGDAAILAPSQSYSVPPPTTAAATPIPAVVPLAGTPVKDMLGAEQINMRPNDAAPPRVVPRYLSQDEDSESTAYATPPPGALLGGPSTTHTNRVAVPPEGGPAVYPDDTERSHFQQAPSQGSNPSDASQETTTRQQDRNLQASGQTAGPQPQSPNEPTKELSPEYLEALRQRVLPAQPGQDLSGQGGALTRPGQALGYRSPRSRIQGGDGTAGANYDSDVPSSNLRAGYSLASEDYNTGLDTDLDVSAGDPTGLVDDEYDESRDVRQRKQQRITQQERAVQRALPSGLMLAAVVGVLVLLLGTTAGMALQGRQQQPPANSTPGTSVVPTFTGPAVLVMEQTRTAEAHLAVTITAVAIIEASTQPTGAPTRTPMPDTPTTGAATPVNTRVIDTVTVIPTTQPLKPTPTTHPLLAPQLPTATGELPEQWAECIPQTSCGGYRTLRNTPPYQFLNGYWVLGDIYLFWTTNMSSEEDNSVYFNKAAGPLTGTFVNAFGLQGQLLGDPTSRVMDFDQFKNLVASADDQLLLTDYMKRLQSNKGWPLSDLRVQFFSTGVVACSNIQPPKTDNSLNLGDCDLLNIGSLMVKQYSTDFCGAVEGCTGLDTSGLGVQAQDVLNRISQPGSEFNNIVGRFQGMTRSKDTAVYERFAITKNGEAITLTPLGQWLKNATQR